MSAPTAKVGLSQGRLVRNSNKHKRLFNPEEPNGVKVRQSCLETKLSPQIPSTGFCSAFPAYVFSSLFPLSFCVCSQKSSELQAAIKASRRI